MTRVTSSVVIARPAEEVFAVLTDVEKTGRWFPADVREYWTSPPPHGVGSTRHAVVTMLGRRSENDAVVTEYDPPRRGAMTGQAAGITWTVTLDFEPVAGGTRVDFSCESSGSGPMRLVIRPFMAWYRRSWQKGLANVKRMMEAGEL